MSIIRQSSRLLNHIFTRNTCVICGQQADQAYALCGYCEHQLPVIEQMADVNNQFIHHHRHHWDQLYGFYHYNGYIESLIKAFKFNHSLTAGHILSHLFVMQAERCMTNISDYDCLIPMPIHRWRHVKRGFNQVQILTKSLARACHLSIDTRLCHRARYTPYQNQLAPEKRVMNVKQVFRLSHKPCYQRVLIIDDVITTGSSLDELARCLKSQGVDQVDACALAASTLQ